MPDTLLGIGSSAFEYCGNLTEIVIPDDLNIHYYYGVQLPMTNAVIEKTETESEYVFEITPEVTYKNCSVYVMLHKEDGILCGIEKVQIETEGSTTISVDKNNDANSAVLLIWSEYFQPVIETGNFDL